MKEEITCRSLREEHALLKEQGDVCSRLLVTKGPLSREFIEAFRVFEEKKKELKELIEESIKPLIGIVTSLRTIWENSTKSYEETDAVILALSGLGIPESMDFRKELMESGRVSPRNLIESLTGVDNRESMDIRENYRKKGDVDYEDIARSLAMVNTPEAVEMRRNLMNDIGKPEESIFQSLVGVDDPESMKIRQEEIEEIGDVDDDKRTEEYSEQEERINSVALSLTGVSTPESMEMRRGLIRLNGESAAFVVMMSLAGVIGQDAVTMRKDIIKKYFDEKEYEIILPGLIGTKDPHSMSIRNRFIKNMEKKFKSDNKKISNEEYELICLSLTGVDTEESIGMRDILFRLRCPEEYIAHSLAGITDEKLENFYESFEDSKEKLRALWFKDDKTLIKSYMMEDSYAYTWYKLRLGIKKD